MHGIEPKELRARSRSPKHPAACRDVPAAGVVIGRNRIAETAFDLDTEHESMKQICPGQPSLLRQCKERRSNGRARMDDGGKMCIVEVEEVRADRIEKGRI
jgi:hypothetical protein